MGLLDWIAGRVGTIDAKTGKRVRLRSHATDDWGNKADHVETKDPHSGEWKRGPTVEGSGTGGHY